MNAYQAALNEEQDETCPKRDDGIHCVHWWDGDACCSCGAGAEVGRSPFQPR